MDIQPAHIDVVRSAVGGRTVVISAEESTVAADLQRIDRRLRIRRAEGDQPHYVVYMVPEGGCPCPAPDCEHGKLVLTAMECDDRIVKRIEYIDPEGRSGYDFVDALEQNRKDRLKREQDARHEHMGAVAEQMAHALRKDLGMGPYQGRVFKPRDL